MSILSLDFGNKLGWALRLNNGKVISGHIDITPKYKKKEHPGLRYSKIKTLISDLSRNHEEINEIAYEDVVGHGSVATAKIWAGIRSIIEEYAYCINVTPCPYVVGEIKREITGKWFGKKEDVRDFVNSYFGLNVKSLDESDALSVLWMHLKATERV